RPRDDTYEEGRCPHDFLDPGLARATARLDAPWDVRWRTRNRRGPWRRLRHRIGVCARYDPSRIRRSTLRRDATMGVAAARPPRFARSLPTAKIRSIPPTLSRPKGR